MSINLKAASQHQAEKAASGYKVVSKGSETISPLFNSKKYYAIFILPFIPQVNRENPEGTAGPGNE
jgi:hypothetical protein